MWPSKCWTPVRVFSNSYRRFLNEARTIAALEHPNIVPIYDVEDRGGLLYIVMRFVPGSSLGALLAARGQLAG